MIANANPANASSKIGHADGRDKSSSNAKPTPETNAADVSSGNIRIVYRQIPQAVRIFRVGQSEYLQGRYTRPRLRTANGDHFLDASVSPVADT